MKAIATKKPRAFQLEHVKGLLPCHLEALRMILGRLRAIGGGINDVGHRLLDTAKHGLPQHRERVFIIGIRRRNLKRKRRGRMSLAPDRLMPPACPLVGPPAGRLRCSGGRAQLLGDMFTGQQETPFGGMLAN